MVSTVNISLLKIIQSEKIVSYERLRQLYFIPKQPNTIGRSVASFNRDLEVLEEEGRININGDIIEFVKRY